VLTAQSQISPVPRFFQIFVLQTHRIIETFKHDSTSKPSISQTVLLVERGCQEIVQWFALAVIPSQIAPRF
jgi:hypothetical protein